VCVPKETDTKKPFANPKGKGLGRVVDFTIDKGAGVRTKTPRRERMNTEGGGGWGERERILWHGKGD